MDGHSDTPHFAQQRQHMVQSQLADRDIVDAKILKTFGRVLRHCFVPPAQCDQAYADHPLPIGAGLPAAVGTTACPDAVVAATPFV